MKMGIQIFDREGHLYFETGVHVLATAPGFTAKIGEIAAIWAVAEGHLGCLYANLLETTPQDALEQLGKRGASQLTEKAKQIAKAKLNEIEQAEFLKLLNSLDAVRDGRNRVQHDLWSRREGKEHALYAIHVDDYRRLILEVVEHGKSADQAVGADQSISAANKYAANASNEYTLESLEQLRAEIETVSVGLFELFVERVRNG